jgi:hypothetical protein
VIDFRYHLVSIVAVFLALAIGIVFGSTELQGHTIDGLQSLTNSLTSQLHEAEAQRDSYSTLSGASTQFLESSENKLLDNLLPGDRLVIVTEPGAPSSVTDRIKQAAGLAGATVTGSVALQPKFNDLTGTTVASLSALNAGQASLDGVQLNAATDPQTANQQQAAQLIATAILNKSSGETGLSATNASLLLQGYEQAGYLTYSGSPTTRATLAVIAIPQTPPANASDPANEILLPVAQEFADASAATVVAGSSAGSATSASALTVLRASSVSNLVSTVDNADTILGWISTIWALANQAAGGKPNSYGISGASAVGPEPPSPAPSPSPSPSTSPSVRVSSTPSTKATGKAKVDKVVKKK